MNSKEEFTIQMKMKVAEIEEILKRYLPEAEGYQKVIMEAMEYSLMAGGKDSTDADAGDLQTFWRRTGDIKAFYGST